MNAWPFVVAAYALVAAGTLLVVLWSSIAMRRAEAAADAVKRPRP